MRLFTFQEHYKELRFRVLISLAFYILCVAIAFTFASELLDFLIKPLAKLLQHEYAEDIKHKLIFTSMAEGFFAEFKLCTHVAFLISIPFFILQIYLFIRPGLHEGEKFAVLLYACFVPLLIILAILIVYYFVIPATWKFFLSFEKQKINTLSMPIMLEAKISEYINLIIELIVGFSLAFQMPIILSLLGRLGLITRNQLVKRRKHAIVIIFIVAAILTPPDVLSQIILALPLILLYELSIILIKFTEKYND